MENYPACCGPSLPTVLHVGGCAAVEVVDAVGSVAVLLLLLLVDGGLGVFKETLMPVMLLGEEKGLLDELLLGQDLFEDVPLLLHGRGDGGDVL